MKAMFTGFAVAIVVAVGAYYALHQMGFSSEDVYSSPNARVE